MNIFINFELILLLFSFKISTCYKKNLPKIEKKTAQHIKNKQSSNLLHLKRSVFDKINSKKNLLKKTVGDKLKGGKIWNMGLYENYKKKTNKIMDREF